MNEKLTNKEVQQAKKLGIFTVTSESGRGYYVTCFRTRGRKEPERLSQGPWRAKYRTATHDQVRLVRSAIKNARVST